MNSLLLTLSLLLTVLVGSGCKKESTVPAPLALEQLPAALQKAFNKAKPQPKDLANQIVASLQAQDYPKAYLGLQKLTGEPGLNKEQQSVTTRGALTVNGLLQSAQTKGDATAAETLKAYRVNK